MLTVVGEVQRVIAQRAGPDAGPSEFACTLLVAVVAGGWTAALQIGDGAIIAVAFDAFRRR